MYISNALKLLKLLNDFINYSFVGKKKTKSTESVIAGYKKIDAIKFVPKPDS